MKFKYVIMTSITAIFLLFIAFLGGNSESDTSFSNVIVEQEVPNKITVKENIPKKEEPIKAPEVKKEDKKAEESVFEYTFNYNDESVKDRSYKVRDDGFAPIYNEPFTEENVNIHAFHAAVMGSYDIDFNPKNFKKEEDLKLYLENNLGVTVNILEFTSKEKYSWGGFATLKIELTDYNAEENEGIKESINQLPEVLECKQSILLLPEYNDKNSLYVRYYIPLLIGQ